MQGMSGSPVYIDGKLIGAVATAFPYAKDPIAGIRPIEIRVPLGTNAGWNVRAPGFRAPNLCGLSGSFVPFATTKTERLAKGDPRKSLQERYKNHEGYVDAVEKAAAELVRERFLLQEDADRFISDAKASSVLR